MTARQRKVRVWIPVILFIREDGSLDYETHGAFRDMVVNRTKRKSCEGDFWSCFDVGGETPAHRKDSPKLTWACVEVPYPPPKVVRAVLPPSPLSPLNVRKNGVFCTRCGSLEPVHAGDGTPLSSFLIGLEGCNKRHPPVGKCKP